MKNEEKNIGRMIDSCLNAGIAAKDISLVDTGSEDGSVEEAKITKNENLKLQAVITEKSCTEHCR